MYNTQKYKKIIAQIEDSPTRYVNLYGKGNNGLKSFALYYADIAAMKDHKIIVRTKTVGFIRSFCRSLLNLFSSPDLWILMNEQNTFPSSDFSIASRDSKAQIITVSNKKVSDSEFTNIKFPKVKKSKIVKKMVDKFKMKEKEI